MAILTVRHITRYRYRRNVELGEHQILFRPRDSFDQRLLDCKIDISPTPASVRWIHDVFGNCVTLVQFDRPTDILVFDCEIRLDHTPESAPDFQIENHAREHPFEYAANEKPDLLPYLERQYNEPDAALQAWLASFLGPPVVRPTGHLLMTLNEAICQSFSYNRRTERGTQAPSVTLHTQRGTCRDFALLMMEAARALGFAARFVSGYIYVPDRDGDATLLGGGSTHAWCQIYLPGSGWVEFDPTNGIVGNRDLVRVAVARMPSQAIPLFGSYFGTCADDLGMDVSVNVKRADQ